MASKPAPFKIEVNFRPREDDGLEAYCDKLPAFFLSHSNPALVIADVEPALAVILSAMYGTSMRVERLREFHESQPTMPAVLRGPREYVGLTQH